jgi:hypothetical protein
VGVGEQFGEAGIVRENEQAAGVKIQAANGEDPGVETFNEVVDGGSKRTLSWSRSIQ